MTSTTGLRETLDWRCAKCDCRSFARCSTRLPDTSFGPGDFVRCVNCKDVSFFPERLSASMAGPEGKPLRVSVSYDGFTGDVIGSYTTREGKQGVVVQQDGTRVVHVYGRSRVEAAPAPALPEAEPAASPAEGAAVQASDIPDLLDRYWDLAYAEGKEGRNHDTINGDAQEVRTKLSLAFINCRSPNREAATREAVIEECAKIADEQVGREAYGHAKHTAVTIAQNIRSLSRTEP